MVTKQTSRQPILMVVNLCANKNGGYENFLSALAPQLRDRGYGVDFLFPAYPFGDLARALESAGARIHVLEGWNQGSRLRQAVRFAHRWLSLLSANHYRLVSFSFCDELPVLLALLAGRCRIASKRSPIAIWHQHSEIRPPRRLGSRSLSVLRIASWALDAICPVYAGAKEAMRLRKISSAKIHILFNGVAFSDIGPEQREAKRRSLGIEKNQFVLFSATSLVPRKNVAMAVRMVALCAEKLPEIILLVAGEGGQLAELEALAASLGQEERIRFLGRRDDVGELIGASDLCVLTSNADASPFFCMEALSHKKAMAATAAGGIPEIVQNGINGVIVPFNDPRALACEVLKLAADPALLTAYGEAGYESVRAKYTLASMVQGYVEYYSRLVAEP